MMSQLGILFLSAFLAATIFPAQSELGLAYLITQTPEHLFLLIFVASLGNTLGAVVNWVLGRGFRSWSILKRLRPAEDKIAQAERWYQRYGYWSLLLSWAPIVGDPITLVAGILREPFWRFFILVAIAKTVRYVVVALIALGFV